MFYTLMVFDQSESAQGLIYIIKQDTNTSNSNIAGLALGTGGPDAITWPNELGEAALTSEESPDEKQMKEEVHACV